MQVITLLGNSPPARKYPTFHHIHTQPTEPTKNPIQHGHFQIKIERLELSVGAELVGCAQSRPLCTI